MHKYFFTATMVITCILFGAGAMYLIDSNWVYDKIERNKDQTNDKMTRYVDALDVSHRLVNNAYDAFYTISECNTSKGCDFKSTVDSLTELNIERKILRLKLDQLLDGTQISWSEDRPL